MLWFRSIFGRDVTRICGWAAGRGVARLLTGARVQSVKELRLQSRNELRPQPGDDREEVGGNQDGAAQQDEDVPKSLRRQLGVPPNEAGDQREVIDAGERAHQVHRIADPTLAK